MFKVVGAALIPHARDVRHYVRLTGKEPGLDDDGPAWVVVFKGEMYMAKPDETWADPVCIVATGRPRIDYTGFYAVGPVRTRSGAIVTPLPAPEPDRTLPPLTP